ncbi:uncharacterized protein LOC131237218 [Magnolia sinica]|uniref:uncharacterized protein LOC131237218 n=1 Tax=Magnolia sinica TaxID=86752 RepID=UPI002657BEB6|nr:uncharacterized protein LOC131237218 [Magnolia sinica]
MEKGLISVDRWGEQSQAYFLTHLHADHTKGLSSKWKKGPLFCSPISANIFPAKFPGFKLSLLRILETGSPHSISLISPTSGSKIGVQVTPIDAHHCPGAVMYLFRGDFGCMLYTGDFRWETANDRALLGKSMLLGALGGDEVDFLYIDNTYCNPSFSFPPREVAAQQVIDVIASHPDHDIVIAIDTLGKEDLLLHISRTFRTKIWVWPERLQIMHLLGFSNIFTTKTSLTRIRAVPRYSLTIENLEALNTIHPTIGIMPSGLPSAMKPIHRKDASVGSSPSLQHSSKVSRNGTDGKPISRKSFHSCIYSIPYSDHSCFNEIQEFVKLIKPSNITGIVSSSFCYVNPRHFFGHLCGSNQQSNKPLKKLKRSEITENDRIIQPESILGCDKLNEEKVRDKNTKIAILSIRRRRVSIIRQEGCGAKIAETNGICRSDFDAGIT